MNLERINELFCIAFNSQNWELCVGLIDQSPYTEWVNKDNDEWKIMGGHETFLKTQFLFLSQKEYSHLYMKRFIRHRLSGPAYYLYDSRGMEKERSYYIEDRRYITQSRFVTAKKKYLLQLERLNNEPRKD